MNHAKNRRRRTVQEKPDIHSFYRNESPTEKLESSEISYFQMKTSNLKSIFMHFFSSSFSIFNHYFHVQFEVNISGVKICGLCLPKISGSLILLCNYNWTKNFGDKLVMITYIPLGRLLLIKTCCCSIVIRKKSFVMLPEALLPQMMSLIGKSL